MKKIKKTLAIFIALVMLLSIGLPMTALADDEVCQIIGTDGEIIKAYDNFADALAEVDTGQTIELLDNINYNGGIVITGKSITFDLNGFTLDVVNASGHALEVGSGGEVLLIDRGGKFNVTGGGSGDRHGVYAHDDGKAEVTNATTSAGGTGARGACATGAGSEVTVYGNVPFGGFYGLGAYAGATLTVYGNVSGGGGMTVSGVGTTVTVYGYSSGGGTGVFAWDGATVYVHGNVRGGGYGVYASSSAQVTIDGTLTATTGKKIYTQVASVDKMQDDHEDESSKVGYYEYKNGSTFVWVKIPPVKIAVTYIYEDQTEYVDQNATNTVADKLTGGAYGATLATAPDPDPTREGYTFDGWFTAANGGGIEWVFGAAGTALSDVGGVDITTRTLTLYAKWNQDTDGENGNGGSETPSPPDRPSPPRPFIEDHVAYVIGYPDGYVRPERNITRAEAATIFFRLLTDDLRQANWTKVNTFSDVNMDSWYNTAVSVMSSMGIVNGYPDGTFKPDGAITRAELAAIAARFARMMEMKQAGTLSFSDISGHWAETDIKYAASIGWVRGYTDGTYRPDRNITRAEFMTLVNRMLEREVETVEDLLTQEMIVWADNAEKEAWYYLAVQEATNSHEAKNRDKVVPGLQFKYEYWVKMIPNRDWSHLEK